MQQIDTAPATPPRRRGSCPSTPPKSPGRRCRRVPGPRRSGTQAALFPSSRRNDCFVYSIVLYWVRAQRRFFMAPALYSHICKACSKHFQSQKRRHPTCSRVCCAKLAGSAPSKLICSCGAPASKRGWCPRCSHERKKQSRRDHYARHKAAILAKRKERYRADQSIKKRMRDTNIRLRFNGLRQDRLQLDQFTCQHCGAQENLVVHHIQKVESRDSADTKSTINDLLTLCRACHINVHRAMGDLEPPALIE